LSADFSIVSQSLSKSYGPHCALSDLTFSTRAGEIIGILGRNGAGKSTTFHLLTTYLKPSSGAASVTGFDLVKESKYVRQVIGYLPESFNLYPELTVEEYLFFIARIRGLAKSDIQKQVISSIELCSLGDYRRVLCGLLSKGYRQRVGLAQAILHRPKVIVLDEPTNGLDPEQVMEFRAVIDSLAAQGATILLSTHILQEVQALCRRVLVLDSGKLVLDSGGLSEGDSFDSVERLFKQAIITEPGRDSYKESVK